MTGLVLAGAFEKLIVLMTPWPPQTAAGIPLNLDLLLTLGRRRQCILKSDLANMRGKEEERKRVAQVTPFS